MAEQQEDIKSPKEQPIIIKKKKSGGHGAPHGGAWKVAYADFVTAMMAFFIVLWILGQSESVKQQIVSYFKDPGAFNFLTGKKTIPVDLQLKPDNNGEGEGKNNKKSDFYFVVPPDQSDTIANKLYEKIHKLALEDSVKAAQKLEQTAEEIKKSIQEQLEKKPELKDILSSIKIEMTKDGLRIELLESKESVFFEVGSTKISPQAKEVLIQIAQEIGKLPNSCEIEGHTDSRNYAPGAIYTNWDLSTDRANAARKLLEESGLWDGQVIKVTGYADKKLRNPDNPFDISNRRISILIKQMNSNEFTQTIQANQQAK